MKLELLVPTMHKDHKGIVELFHKMNIHSDVLFANQCDDEWNEEFEIDGYSVRAISTKTRGVSVNRNILLKNFKADFGLYMDDDGVMNETYQREVLDFVKKNNDAKFIKFNFTLSSKDDDRPHYLIKKTKKAKYTDVSPFGMPGFMIARDVAQKENVLFDEKIGVPNYISHGEDSVFIKLMFNLKVPTYVSTIYIGHINNEDSTWFKDFDERYFVSQGYLYTAMHGKWYMLFILRMYFIHHKEYNKYKLKSVIKFAKKGHAMFIGGKNDD